MAFARFVFGVIFFVGQVPSEQDSGIRSQDPLVTLSLEEQHPLLVNQRAVFFY